MPQVNANHSRKHIEFPSVRGAGASWYLLGSTCPHHILVSTHWNLFCSAANTTRRHNSVTNHMVHHLNQKYCSVPPVLLCCLVPNPLSRLHVSRKCFHLHICSLPNPCSYLQELCLRLCTCANANLKHLFKLQVYFSETHTQKQGWKAIKRHWMEILISIFQMVEQRVLLFNPTESPFTFAQFRGNISELRCLSMDQL